MTDAADSGPPDPFGDEAAIEADLTLLEHLKSGRKTFVEDLCSVEGMPALIKEIERVIFEAHPLLDRDGALDFDELLELRVRHHRDSRRQEEVALAGVSEQMEVRVGKALQLLPAMDGERFDAAFLDADKEPLPTYLDWALRLVRPGDVSTDSTRGGSASSGTTASVIGSNRLSRMGVSENRVVAERTEATVSFTVTPTAVTRPRPTTTASPRTNGVMSTLPGSPL